MRALLTAIAHSTPRSAATGILMPNFIGFLRACLSDDDGSESAAALAFAANLLVLGLPLHWLFANETSLAIETRVTESFSEIGYWRLKLRTAFWVTAVVSYFGNKLGHITPQCCSRCPWNGAWARVGRTRRKPVSCPHRASRTTIRGLGLGNGITQPGFVGFGKVGLGVGHRDCAIK